MATDVPPEAVNDMAKTISFATQKTMVMNGTGNPFDTSFIGLVGAMASLQCVAILVGKHRHVSDRDDVNDVMNAACEAINDQTLMFTGLMFAASASKTFNNKGEACTDVHFGIEEMMQAREWYEKLTGEKPDKHLCRDLVDILQAVEAAADAPLTKFMENRTLN